MKKLKHIVEYFSYIIFAHLIKILSIDQAASLCSAIARRLGPLLAVSNVARNNLHQVYGNTINIDHTIDGLWTNFGRYIGEFPFINALSTNEVNQRVKIIGVEHISHFQHTEQPFLLFLCHQANWDLVIRKVNDLYPQLAIIYRQSNNPYIDKIILQQRQGNTNNIMIAKGPLGAKDIAKAIKLRYSIVMLVDQKMNDGISVPFFGLPAMTAHAIARLSIKYHYPLVPLQIVRLGHSSYFELRVHPPLEYLTTNNLDQDCYNIMCTVNTTLENFIRQHPEQWFWFHNRWGKGQRRTR